MFIMTRRANDDTGGIEGALKEMQIDGSSLQVV
jgi:hypothetical protein